MKIFPLLACTFALSSVVTAQTPAQQKAARAVFDRFRALNQANKLNTPPARALVMGEATSYVKDA